MVGLSKVVEGCARDLAHRCKYPPRPLTSSSHPLDLRPGCVTGPARPAHCHQPQLMGRASNRACFCPGAGPIPLSAMNAAVLCYDRSTPSATSPGSWLFHSPPESSGASGKGWHGAANDALISRHQKRAKATRLSPFDKPTLGFPSPHQRPTGLARAGRDPTRHPRCPHP